MKKSSAALIAVLTAICRGAEAFHVATRPIGARSITASTTTTRLNMAVSKEDLVGAREMIDGILDEKNW